MLSRYEQLNKASKGYLDAGMPKPTATPLNTDLDIPINQKSFAAPGSAMSGDVPSYGGGSAFVPGVGLLGADLGGAVKGTMMRQEYQMNAAKNNREEEELGINKVKLGQNADLIDIAKAQLGIQLNDAAMKTRTDDQEQAIQQGMILAAQNGGFPAVIEYLKNADPQRALEFQVGKLKLDNGIMENETYQSAHQNDKSAAMLQGYSLLGGLGATLLKANPEDREKAWKSLAPIAKQIDPSISSELNNDVVGKLALGMSLSTPAAQLYDAKKADVEYQSAAGKIMGDLEKTIAVNGANSEQAQVLQNALNNNMQLSSKNQLQVASTIAQNQANGEHKLREQWLGITKDASTMAQSNSAVQKSTQSAKLPDGTVKGPDDMATIYNYFKMLDPTSAIMPGEYANAENTAGWAETRRKEYNKLKDGGKLTDAQRMAFAKSAETLYQSKAQQYYSLKDQFSNIAKNNNYNPENVLVDRLDDFRSEPTPEAIQFLLKNPTTEMQTQFQLKYGQDAKNKVLQQMQGGQPNGQ